MTKPSHSLPLPDWAIEHARAALRIGRSAPDIEQLLVARGLAPEAAASVVNRVLEDHVREAVEPQERAQRRLWIHRILSAIIALMYIIPAFWLGGVESALKVLAGLLLPLACIWFGDQMGSATGPIGLLSPWITFSTPGVFVRLGGWLVLLAAPVTVVIVALIHSHW
jgi:hypothetical protein